jgi:hypothetical protein
MAIRGMQARIMEPTAVSGTTVYYSKWVQIGSFNTFGALVTNVGTATGTITMQVGYSANQPGDDSIVAPLNFTTTSFQRNLATVANVAVTANASFAIETGITSASWVRVVYTNATNTGTVTIDAVAKSLSA